MLLIKHNKENIIKPKIFSINITIIYLNTPYIVKYLSEPETNNIILENKKSTKINEK